MTEKQKFRRFLGKKVKLSFQVFFEFFLVEDFDRKENSPGNEATFRRLFFPLGGSSHVVAEAGINGVVVIVVVVAVVVLFVAVGCARGVVGTIYIKLCEYFS